MRFCVRTCSGGQSVIGQTLPSHQAQARSALGRKPPFKLRHYLREAWRTRCAIQDDAEHRALALLTRAEAVLQAANKPATIRTVWMLLADRASTSSDADAKAAALAGMAMGLQPT